MIKEIEKKIKKYVIIFHDKSVKWVNEKKAINISTLMDDGQSKLFNIEDKGVYNTNTISKILSEQEYYEQYPNKKPEPILDQYKKYSHLENQLMPKNARSEMLKGIKKHNGKNAQELYNSKNPLKELKNKLSL